MKIFALVGTLAFVLTGAVVGTRMLLLARRTGERPELYVGAGLFAFSVIAQPSLVAGRVLFESYGIWAYMTALSIGLSATILTMLGVYLFTWQVFRKDSAAAGAFVRGAIACAIAAAGALLWSLSGTGPTDTYAPATRAAIVALVGNFAVAMGWTASEALRYHDKMRRRLALGLADPIVVNRFLVWGVGCAACFVSALTTIVITSMGINIVSHPVPMLTTASAGMVCAAGWYLSFLPPAWYLRLIERRAAASAAA